MSLSQSHLPAGLGLPDGGLIGNLSGYYVAQEQSVLSPLPAALVPGKGPGISGQEWEASASPLMASDERVLRIRGTLRVRGMAYPEQEWVVTIPVSGSGVVFENRPEHSWPFVRIQFRSSVPLAGETLGQFLSYVSKETVTDLAILPHGDNVEAEVLYTRVVLSLDLARVSSLVDSFGDVVFTLRHDPLPETSKQDMVERAKLYRKLRFVETVFDAKFSLPPSEITADEIRLADIVFNGISSGIAYDRGSDITVQNVFRSELDLTKPPFTGPGEFRRTVSHEGRYVGLFGRTLDVGKVTLILRNAEIADSRTLEEIIRNPGRPVALRFIVYDHQIEHRFESYANRPSKKRSAKLDSFKAKLGAEEPVNVASLISAPLARDVPARRAIQIATGWLYLNQFPDRYCPQEPVLDSEAEAWRVPIRLIHPDGSGGPVGELNVSLKTGRIATYTPVNEMRKRGRALAETLVHA